MTLFFTESREHAVLGLVIKEAQSAPNVGYFGRTALQKVVYFLKALGVPLRYKFDIYHYGPYSDQITSDLDLLIADQVVVDKGTAGTYFNYKIESAATLDELLANHKQFIDEYLTLIRNVVKVFGGLKPEDLELYATLHYAYRFESASGQMSRESILARFEEYKRAKFPARRVEKALDEMIKVKLVTLTP